MTNSAPSLMPDGQRSVLSVVVSGGVVAALIGLFLPKARDSETLRATLLAAAGWGPTGINTADNRQLLLAWNDVFWGAEPPPMGFTGDLATCVPGTTSADYRLAELETLIKDAPANAPDFGEWVLEYADLQRARDLLAPTMA